MKNSSQKEKDLHSPSIFSFPITLEGKVNALSCCQVACPGSQKELMTLWNYLQNLKSLHNVFCIYID